MFRQVVVIDRLLGGEFSTYGLQAARLATLPDEERSDPMATVFPKVTKCTFHNFGSSGTVQRFDGMCVLPINMLNDKIFLVVWLWLFLLLVITSLHLVFRLATILSSQVRISYLRVVVPALPGPSCRHLQHRLAFGDWLLISMLGGQLELKQFHSLLLELERVGRQQLVEQLEQQLPSAPSYSLQSSVQCL